ncbi:hypothetical protein EELLY_v1c03280 [Entomoplasma ellychniae]|uniref:S1 motif domain-containing protein n=2 Tax=Entomoplasmataceae TaxID=33925 RepID=A0A2S5RHK8_9MOLU|nr:MULTISPECIES: S1 RNA-binding domain-containing protein [Entomoplasmataceae]PPE04648.1 hypothetical protein EELLY_v1c03280 [Entomoplasma ellychniae]PPE06791.1 hypothetical protein MCORR_v1c04220 [Mesoplasma corruscae]
MNTVITAQISDIAPFGAFAIFELDGKQYKGLIHISEIANSFVTNINDFVKVGEDVQVLILELNEEKAQAKLSIKQV